MMERAESLKEFKYKDFFEATSTADPKIPYVLLNSSGMQLINDYYADKYEVPHFKNFKSFDQLADYIASEDFKVKIKTIDNIRIPFVVTTIMHGVDGPYPHSTPVLFVKENAKQGIAAFDSIALSPKNLAEYISKKISVFTTKDWDDSNTEKSFSSQRDFFSCHAGTMVYFKIMAGKVDGQYIMPNLFDSLMQNAKPINNRNLYATTLPNSLLITVQDKRFFSIQQPNRDAIVHKNHDKDETLADFLARYPETADFGKESRQHVSGYVRIKGLKYANIIEIQFYINQFKERLGADFTPEMRERFIKDAKKLFKEQGELSSKSIKHRQGLHRLAEDFLANFAKMKMEEVANQKKEVQSQEIQPIGSSNQLNSPVQTQENIGTKELSPREQLIMELNECLNQKNWANAVQVLLVMTPDSLKDPAVDKLIQQPSVQDEIRKEYQLFLDKIKNERNQRSKIIKNVLEKKSALGAILCPGKENPFFGAKEIRQQPIKVVKVGPSVQKKV